MSETLTITLPEPVARRVRRAAELTYRSVDEIVLSSLEVALGIPPNAPLETRDELMELARLSDAALRAASETTMSLAQQRRLRQLGHAGGARPLTVAEQTEQAHLLEIYGQAVLRRAMGLALLAYRGYELPQRNDLPDFDETDNEDYDA